MRLLPVYTDGELFALPDQASMKFAEELSQVFAPKLGPCRFVERLRANIHPIPFLELVNNGLVVAELVFISLAEVLRISQERQAIVAAINREFRQVIRHRLACL